MPTTARRDRRTPIRPRARARTAASTEIGAPEVAIDAFLAKFEPTVARLIRACRADLKKLLPKACELVYDNYNFFVIGYASTERASDCIVSLAAASNGVTLMFYYGAELADPDGLLQGTGKQNRFIRLPTVETLRASAVIRLIRAAAREGAVPLRKTGRGATIIKSISAKQRPRRRILYQEP